MLSIPTPLLQRRLECRLEMRSIKKQAHKHAAKRPCDGNGHDPGDDEQTDTLPVNGFPGAIAEANTDGGTGDAHRRGHGQRLLGKDEDGNGGAHLHGAAARGRMVGDFVAHDFHNVVAISDEADGDGG